MTGCTAGQQVSRSTGHLVHGLWLRLGRVLGSQLLVSYYWGSRWLLRPLMFAAGSGLVVIDFRPGDYRTAFDGSVQRPQTVMTPTMRRAWTAFEGLMRSGPAPEGAAEALRRALFRGRSGTVRTGRFFQATLAPFLARFGSQGLQRRIRARYFDLS